MKTVIPLQAYGAAVNINQNVFCLLSLLKHLPAMSADVKIAVYTDQQKTFESFFGAANPRIEYFDLSPERVKQWRGSINFVHRVKIEMIRDVAKPNPQANIFYVDGDTIFLKDPTPLFANIDDQTTIMHELENVISEGREPISKKIAKFLKAEEFEIDGVTQKLPKDVAMYNAGVLGFSPNFFSRLDAVLKLTEDMHSRFQKHVMEQLAFSYYLQKQTRIVLAGEYVLHYWRQKEIYNDMIAKFLGENHDLTSALKSYDNIQFAPAPQPKRRGLAKIFSLFGGRSTTGQTPRP